MRMAEAGTTVFAATAALARANRALSNSTANHLHEANLATAFAKEASDNVRDILYELAPNQYLKSDFVSQRMADYIFGQGSYPFVHPITKNVF